MLRDEYELSFRRRKAVFEETLYARTEPLAAAAKKVMNQIAMVGMDECKSYSWICTGFCYRHRFRTV